jgi:hypothetical protein
MVQFSATIKKFDKQGEKTGWTYIELPDDLAQSLKPGNKKSFRVKGKLDQYAIEKVALMPMGNGAFILPLNAAMRKGTGKGKGATLQVWLQEDSREITPPSELIECLKDEPEALAQYNHLARSHQHYFTRWINEAKTEATKAKRIALTVNSLLKGQDFGTMLRNMKKENEEQSTITSRPANR